MKDNYIFNTGESQLELNNRYNSEGSQLRKAQLRMLQMLLYIDSVCKELGIEYFIEGGNALGAVRHGGFIPWDDDVDIDVKRSDFKKLCSYLITHPHPQFVLQTHNTDDGFFAPWVVLRDIKSEYVQDTVLHNLRKYKGLQVDIFPLERKPSRLFKKIGSFLENIKDVYLLGKRPYMCDFLYHLMHNLLFPFFRFIDKFNIGNNYYMYCYGHGNLKRFEEDMIFPTKPIIYEGYEVMAPHNIEKYLSHFFGNYMELPSIGDRNKHSVHSIKIYE